LSSNGAPCAKWTFLREDQAADRPAAVRLDCIRTHTLALDFHMHIARGFARVELSFEDQGLEIIGRQRVSLSRVPFPATTILIPALFSTTPERSLGLQSLGSARSMF